MTPAEIAAKAAEEVFRVIERNKRINMGDITEAIAKVLATSQVTPAYTSMMLARPYDVMPGDNDHWSVAAWSELVRTRLRKAEARRQADCKKLGIEFVPSAGYASICGND